MFSCCKNSVVAPESKHPKTPPARPPAASAKDFARKPLALLAEDASSCTKMIKRQLEQQGYEVIVAQTAEIATDRLNVHPHVPYTIIWFCRK